ncbi:hypothetical protein GTP41_02100 [Pseudoduganella sp. DS3]|uniref:Uncharacterized protein n=1 Tax=Pseudoduganella guangdongensis TaxID=2692179 RepID=A0A6N9HCY0_9BURK|nr:hypothetical protein [Pseudoduganella guangdongensis]MYN00883.1 hypothetical protein [Pseudoduganella guangdongensis]
MNWLFRPAHLSRMQKIQEKKRLASEPAQISEIEKEEMEELERYADKVQETCEFICRNNPK